MLQNIPPKYNGNATKTGKFERKSLNKERDARFGRVDANFGSVHRAKTGATGKSTQYTVGIHICTGDTGEMHANFPYITWDNGRAFETGTYVRACTESISLPPAISRGSSAVVHQSRSLNYFGEAQQQFPQQK